MSHQNVLPPPAVSPLLQTQLIQLTRSARRLLVASSRSHAPRLDLVAPQLLLRDETELAEDSRLREIDDAGPSRGRFAPSPTKRERGGEHAVRVGPSSDTSDISSRGGCVGGAGGASAGTSSPGSPLRAGVCSPGRAVAIASAAAGQPIQGLASSMRWFEEGRPFAVWRGGPELAHSQQGQPRPHPGPPGHVVSQTAHNAPRPQAQAPHSAHTRRQLSTQRPVR